MKKLLLSIIALVTINICFGTTHIIDWTTNTHVTTNIIIGDTVQWNFTGFHDVTSSGSPSFTSSATQSGGSYSFQFNTLGDYYYFCSVHGAGSMDGNIIVSPMLSVEDEELVNFTIYPNPSSNVLNLKLTHNNKSTKIEVFDVLGKLTYNAMVNSETSINVTNWNSGLYFVKLSSENLKITKRFVKE